MQQKRYNVTSVEKGKGQGLRMALLLTTLAVTWLGVSFTNGDPALPRYGQPLRGTLMLTGNFGELRSNHFHAGLDLRGAVGTPVYAIGDGYVSRIVADISGFGQAIYISHPEGYTSVYGHLEGFSDSLLAYVRRAQYAEETFAVDLRPDPTALPVRRGALIGYVGNRGASQGPHLHFEIRRSENDSPVNPLAFGYSVADTRPPDVRQVRIYELDSRGNVIKYQTFGLRYTPAGRRPETDTVYVNHPNVGLAFKAYDQQNSLNNLNGIYSARLLQDGQLRYRFAFDNFTFEESRYLNAHIDYADRRRNNSWFHRLFRLPGNQLSLYDRQAGDGIVPLLPNQTVRLEAYAADRAGNTTPVTVVVKRQPGPPPVYTHYYNYFLPYDEASHIDNGHFTARFTDDALYEDCYLRYQQVAERSSNVFSDVHMLHDPNTPIHHYYTIGVRPLNLPESLRDKALIAYCHNGNRPVSYGGKWGDDGRLYTEVRTFGGFCIMADTIPPTIRPLFKSSSRGRTPLRFRIDDNFPTSGPANALRYRATVDGKWILLEYDLKYDLLALPADVRLPAGLHTLRLEVTDDRGNTAVWEGTVRG